MYQKEYLACTMCVSNVYQELAIRVQIVSTTCVFKAHTQCVNRESGAYQNCAQYVPNMCTRCAQHMRQACDENRMTAMRECFY